MNRFLLRANPNPAFKVAQPLPHLAAEATEAQKAESLHQFVAQRAEHLAPPKFPAALLKVEMFQSANCPPAT